MVFVVPDADWIDNPMVDWQALLVRTYLREALGDSMVYIAAPPVEFYECHRGAKKGVDDWLGTNGSGVGQKHADPPGIDGLIIRGKEPGRGAALLADLGLPERTGSTAMGHGC